MAEKFTTLCSSCFQETINMLSSSKQLNRCIIPATFNLGCVFVFFFFQNDECDNNGGISVYNLHCSFKHTNCSSKRYLSRCSARCTTGIWGHASLNRDKDGTKQSMFLQGDLFFVKLKIYYFSLRTNYEISQIWSP